MKKFHTEIFYTFKIGKKIQILIANRIQVVEKISTKRMTFSNNEESNKQRINVRNEVVRCI